jgi:opacity protein-like surface antigen
MSMQPTRIAALPALVVVSSLVVVCAAPAFAQQGAPPQPVERRDYGWVSIAAGATFGSETDRATAFAGEWGEDIIPSAQAYVTVSYFENLMRQDLTDDLAELSASLTSTTGTPWNLRGRDRGVTLIAGGRYLLNSGGTIHPYVGGGAGVLNIDRTIADARAGDVTASVLSEFNIGELTVTTKNLTRPILEGAAGVAFFNGPVYVDVGYRYHRAFHLDETFDFSQAIVGIGYKF